MTALDMEDAWKKSRESFKEASRMTDADSKADLKSVDRKLDTYLRLVTQMKLGQVLPPTPTFAPAVHPLLLHQDLFWDLPWTIRKDGESMRLAAERALTESCGEHLQLNVTTFLVHLINFYSQAQILGNAPGSFYKYKYPKHYSEKSGAKGAKVFIFKGYLKHQLRSDPGVAVQVRGGW